MSGSPIYFFLYRDFIEVNIKPNKEKQLSTFYNRIYRKYSWLILMIFMRIYNVNVPKRRFGNLIKEKLAKILILTWLLD